MLTNPFCAGLNGLAGFKVENSSFTLVPAFDGSNFLATAILPNPANLTIEVGDIAHELFVDDTKIGTSMLNNVTISPGTNRLPLRGSVDVAAMAPVLLKYTNGNIPIQARGRNVTYNGVSVPYLSKALAATPLTINMDVAELLAGASGSAGANPLKSLGL